MLKPSFTGMKRHQCVTGYIPHQWHQAFILITSELVKRDKGFFAQYPTSKLAHIYVLAQLTVYQMSDLHTNNYTYHIPCKKRLKYYSYGYQIILVMQRITQFRIPEFYSTANLVITATTTQLICLLSIVWTCQISRRLVNKQTKNKETTTVVTVWIWLLIVFIMCLKQCRPAVLLFGGSVAQIGLIIQWKTFHTYCELLIYV